MISAVHWHFTWQSPHNIASGLASRGYRILYVEPLPKRWPPPSEWSRVWGRIVGQSKAAGMCEQPLVEGIELISPRLLPDVDALSQAINRQAFVPAIARGLKQQISDVPLIVIDYLPTSASVALLQSLEADASFYHCYYDWANDPYHQGKLAERQLAEAVDMIWADSPVNFQRASSMNPNVITLAKGVNVSLFAQARQLSEPTRDRRPRCAFFGTVGIHTDIELLRAVSHRYPLRIIGPVRVALDGFAVDTEFIGTVPHSEVPEHLRDADVLLLPYDGQSPHMAGVMPAKLFECLATGKPVVVAGLTSLGDLEPLFYMAANEQEFLQAIEDAASEDPALKAARIACAEDNSNERRIDEIEGYIAQVLEAKQKSNRRAVSSSTGAEAEQTT